MILKSQYLTSDFKNHRLELNKWLKKPQQIYTIHFRKKPQHQLGLFVSNSVQNLTETLLQKPKHQLGLLVVESHKLYIIQILKPKHQLSFTGLKTDSKVQNVSPKMVIIIHQKPKNPKKLT